MSTAGQNTGNKAFYLSYAPYYDAGRKFFYNNEKKRVYSDFSLIEKRKKLSTSTILDIGSGTGFYSLVAAQYGALKFHCLDLNSTFLDLTKQKILEYSKEADITCYENDLESFLSNSPRGILKTIDVVILAGILQHLPNNVEILAEIIKSFPTATIYITSHKLSSGYIASLIENVFIPIDYKLHRVVHKPPKQKHFHESLSTNLVHKHEIKSCLENHEYELHDYNYTTYHTSLFNTTQMLLKKIMPFWGNRFTIIGHPNLTK